MPAKHLDCITVIIIVIRFAVRCDDAPLCRDTNTAHSMSLMSACTFPFSVFPMTQRSKQGDTATRDTSCMRQGMALCNMVSASHYILCSHVQVLCTSFTFPLGASDALCRGQQHGSTGVQHNAVWSMFLNTCCCLFQCTLVLHVLHWALRITGKACQGNSDFMVLCLVACQLLLQACERVLQLLHLLASFSLGPAYVRCTHTLGS